MHVAESLAEGFSGGVESKPSLVGSAWRISTRPVVQPTLSRLAERFGEEVKAVFGFRVDRPVRLVRPDDEVRPFLEGPRTRQEVHVELCALVPGVPLLIDRDDAV